ncbi:MULTISPECIES: hypothetical protein [unclassified Amycolatopsis]
MPGLHPEISPYRTGMLDVGVIRLGPATPAQLCRALREPAANLL